MTFVLNSEVCMPNIRSEFAGTATTRAQRQSETVKTHLDRVLKRPPS